MTTTITTADFTTNNTTEFSLPSNYITTALKLASKDFLNWEKKNARKKAGGKQCFNTLPACQMGALSEAASIFWLKSSFEKQQPTLEAAYNGMQERRTGKSIKGSDIEYTDVEANQVLRIEVKGVRPHQKHGQITPYHVNKYIKEGVALVIFVEVDFNEHNNTAACKIYAVKTPEFCKKSPLKPNHYGNMCHTLPLEAK